MTSTTTASQASWVNPYGYHILFNESVSGLDIGGPVKFQGLKIGKLEAMCIDLSDMRLTRIKSAS